MEKYYCYRDAIDDLNERGFINDFVLFGDELLWIQQRTFIQSADFSIVECHHCAHPDGNIEDLVVLGILSISANIKGILLNHYSYTRPRPQIIISKLHTAK